MTKENPNWSFYTTTDAAGRVYVIASYSEWVPEKRQPRIAERVHVGRLLDDQRVKLGKTFCARFPQYEGKEVYYRQNRLLSREEIEAIPEYQAEQAELRAAQEEAEREAAEAPEADEDERNCILDCGSSWAAWISMKTSGVLDDLEATFGKETATDLANLAIYTFCSKSGAMQSYEEWIYRTWLPDPRPLSSQRISEILKTITQEQMDAFYKRRHDRALARGREARAKLLEEHPELRDSQLLPPLQVAFDSTSISTYSETIKNAERGYNKQGEELKQVNLAAVCDQVYGEFLYACEYQGSINDAASLAGIIGQMKDAGIDLSEVLLVADRGYQTNFNVQCLLDEGIRFVVGVPLSSKSVKACFDKNAASLRSYKYRVREEKIFAYTPNSAEVDRWYQKLPGGDGTVEAKMFLHLYRNQTLEEERADELLAKLERIVKAKNEGNRIEDTEWRSNKKYLKEDKSGRWSVDMDKYAAAAEKLGYFCIRTNACPSNEEALKHYGQRQAVEEGFKRFKATNGSNRMLSTEAGYRGRLFTYLLAESVRCTLAKTARRTAQETGQDIPGNSLDKLLGRVDGVRLRRVGRGGRSWRPFLISRRQRDGFKLLGVPAPAGTLKS